MTYIDSIHISCIKKTTHLSLEGWVDIYISTCHLHRKKDAIEHRTQMIVRCDFIQKHLIKK